MEWITWFSLRNLLTCQGKRRSSKTGAGLGWFAEKSDTGKDAKEARVLYPDDSSVKLLDIFPIAQWADLYDTHRWQGYIFAPPDTQEAIAPIARDVLKERYGFSLKAEAFKWCKFLFLPRLISYSWHGGFEKAFRNKLNRVHNGWRRLWVKTSNVTVVK